MERSGPNGETPMSDAKGSTNPPFGDYAHRIIDSNIVASDYLFDALEGTEHCGVRSTNGIYFSEILGDLRYDPGQLQTWRDRDQARLRAFRECCLHVARGVIYIFHRTGPDREEMERRLDLDYDDAEAFVVRRHPSDEDQLEGRTRRGRTLDVRHTQRLMVEQLEQLERSTGYKGWAAMEILAERKQKEGRDWTPRKIKDARTFVNKERAGEEVAVYSDRFHDFEDGAA